MGKKYFSAVVLILLIAGIGYAQNPSADLTLQGTVTETYISYLQNQEATWQDQVDNMGGDTPETMKAHMGLALLSLAYTHVDDDTTFRRVDSLMAVMGSSIGNAYNGTVWQVVYPAVNFFEDPHWTVNHFTNFFESGQYETFRDSMEVWANDFSDAADEAGLLSQMFIYNTETHLSHEELGSHLLGIQDGTADFEFTLTFADGDFADSLFVFSRDFFNRVDLLDSLSNEMLNHFEDGFTYADSVGNITGADMDPAIASWRMGASSLNTLIDSLETTVQLQPFSPLNIDPNAFNKLQSNVTEIDTLLGGKIYQFGPVDEGKTIKPVVIIENLPGAGLENIYADFYRTNTPASYAFGGIFPSGLDSQTLEFLSPDVVLNAMDDMETMQVHLSNQRDLWQSEIAGDPADPDAHFGVALTIMYDLMVDYPQTLSQIYDLLDTGRLDVLATDYQWSDVDFSEELEWISYHLNYYTGSLEPTNFVILVKTANDGYGPYEIGATSEFEIMHLPVPAVYMASVQIRLMSDAATMITDGLEHIYHNLDRMFVLDLDPNLLDFSDIESDSMLILRLEQANPEFMTITPYGVSEFHKAGENLRDAFEEMGTFFDEMTDLAQAMMPYQDDFGMDAMSMMYDMQEASDIHWMLYEDFAHPDTSSYIDGERVNFSAWFDNPPQSFLQMWKDYVFGVDSTLGGLFPDRYSVDVEDELPTLPREFTVYPAYPNPFNPETSIRFDLPKSEHVNVTIYNIRGERIATLVDEVLPAGQKLLQWNGQGISSGIYYVRISYRGQSATQKLVLLK